MSAEAQLVFRSAGGPENDPALCNLATRELRWDRVNFLAERETASAVFCRRLRELPCATANGASDEIQKMRQLARVSEFHLLMLQQRLEEAVAALASAGLEVVLLKGAGLAYTVYASFSARPMSDIDLLIEVEHADEVRELLATLGWDWNRDAAREKQYERHHHLPPMFYSRGIGTSLELHTDLFIPGSPLLLTAADIRRSARLISIGGHSVLVPSPHDQLLHACLHFAWSHAMRGGAWRTFRDIDAIVHSGEVRWQEFVRLARASRGATCCYWAFQLAAVLGGVTGVPTDVLQALRPAQPEFVMKRLERHFASQLSVLDATCPSEALNRMVWVMGVMPGRSGHGDVRPWDQISEFESLENQEGGHALQKMTHHVRNIGQWVRYARMMLLPASG